MQEGTQDVQKTQEPQEIQITPEQRASFLQELKDKGGLDNFYANVKDGHRREGFKDDIKAQQRKNPDRLLGKNMREYWDNIDAAIEKEGVDKERIRNMQDKIRSGSGDSGGLAQELNAFLLPIYLRLRASGYSHKDLAT